MTAFSGHFWTVGTRLVRSVRRPALPAGVPWSTILEDAAVGPVRLGGWLHQLVGASGPAATPQHDREHDGDRGDTVLVLVHGLGGCADSAYMHVATAAAARLAETPNGRRLGAVIRLSVRGADRSGEDLYHAGLTADLHGVLAAPELAGYRRFLVLGFSLGGHLALRYASEAGDPRLGAVAAISPPLDLAAGANALDTARRAPYRHYLMGHLHEIYAAVAARRPMPLAVDEVRRLRHIRTFDEATVAPRFGFNGASDYYERESAGPRLGGLRVPALLLASAHDPMVPIETLVPYLESPPSALTVRIVDAGGHVAFPPRLVRRLDLDEPTVDGAMTATGSSPGERQRRAPIEATVLRWLLRANDLPSTGCGCATAGAAPGAVTWTAGDPSAATSSAAAPASTEAVPA